jgi:hypothetical protein
VVRVRVCAPFEIRVERMMKRLATEDRATVENEIQLSEEAHTAITKRHFGVNWRDPENYDLVLNTERLSVEECVDEVENVMRKPRFQETPESIRLVENLALEWAVRAALRRDPSTAASSIVVECSEGKVKLAGIVNSATESLAVAEVATGVPGVSCVNNHLRATDSGSSAYRRE